MHSLWAWQATSSKGVRCFPALITVRSWLYHGLAESDMEHFVFALLLVSYWFSTWGIFDHFSEGYRDGDITNDYARERGSLGVQQGA